MNLIKILIIIWELPQTLLACIIIVFIKGKIVKRQTFRNVNIFYVKDFPGGISLGRFIILDKRYSNNELTIRHEYGHTIQSIYLGWFYLLIIGIPSITRIIIWRLLKLDSPIYYKGYPENWADKLGFIEEERKKRVLQKNKKLI